MVSPRVPRAQAVQDLRKTKGCRHLSDWLSGLGKGTFLNEVCNWLELARREILPRKSS